MVHQCSGNVVSLTFMKPAAPRSPGHSESERAICSFGGEQVVVSFRPHMAEPVEMVPDYAEFADRFDALVSGF